MSVRRARLCLESLESRELLAGNLSLTAVRLVDGSNNLLTAPVIGQQIHLRAEWSANGLNVGQQYTIRFSIGGVAVDSGTITHTSNGNFFLSRPCTWASNQQHTATVTLDPLNSVAETNESDNVSSINFTPVAVTDLPQLLRFPLVGTANQDWSITNYADVDPRSGTRSDFRGGSFQYDGHDAIDVGTPNFAGMDAGQAVVAAADGIVSFVSDGEFDRNTSFAAQDGNNVVIDHGNGWQTVYAHFAKDSIVVSVGDVVTQGQLLGLMGSSGFSTGQHLHIGLLYRNAAVETMYSPSSYWLSPLPYQGDATTTVQRSGITNMNFGNDSREAISDINTFVTGVSSEVWYYFYYSNFQPSAQYTVTWYRPNGAVYFTDTTTPGTQQPGLRAAAILPTFDANDTGTWRVAVSVGGNEIDSKNFFVTNSGVPEIRVTQPATSTLILNNRSTPLNFGTVALAGSGPTQTYRIQNHGNATLTLANLSLPTGFSLVGSFPTSVNPGSTADFTIRLDSTTAGRKFGQVRFTSNDADEGSYGFLVEGVVNGSLPAGTPTVTLPGRATAYNFGSSPVLVDATATFSDSESNYNGGSLTVEILSGATSNDRLSIAHQGTGSGQIAISGNSVSFGGVTVATMSGGSGSTPLVLSFNSAATPAIVQALLRRVSYANIAASPEPMPRFLGVRVSDPSSNVSEIKTNRVSVLPIGTANVAPTLIPANTINLTAVNETDTNPAGDVVGTLVTAAITDPDVGQTLGIAVTAVSGTSLGTWQYSRNNGATWLNFGAVTSTSARLLAPTDRVRFLPTQAGTASLSYRAWDGSSGAAGSTANITTTGGTSAFSSDLGTSSLNSNFVNRPPSFTGAGNITATEDIPTTLPNWASNLNRGDSDEGSQTLTFLVSASNSSLFSVQPAISDTGTLTFTPAANASGSTSVSVTLRDSLNADSPTQTFTITINPINDAPTLTNTANVALTSVRSVSGANPGGDLISALISGRVSDPDNTQFGVAITGFTSTAAGSWQYSLDGGISWLALGAVSASSARLLRDTDRVRFLPTAGVSGTASLTYRAWDRSTGTAGALANASSVGGSSAFGNELGSASLDVIRVAFGLMEDTTNPTGATVGSFLGTISDPDPLALRGLALTAVTGTSSGRWQYSLNAGSTWLNVPSVAESSALLLRDIDRVRFIPNTHFFGSVDLTFRVWDQTVGVPGGLSDLSPIGSVGGNAAYSNTTRTVPVDVLPINDAPILTAGTTLLTSVPTGTLTPPPEMVSRLLQGVSSDVDSASLGVAVVASTGSGTWQYSLDAETTWLNVGTVSTTTARLLSASDRIRFVPNPAFTGTATATLSYRAWDQSVGLAGATSSITGTAFSTVTRTASIATNQRPILTSTAIVDLPAMLPNTSSPNATLIDAILSGRVNDADSGALSGLAVTATAGTGTWQYSLDGVTWLPIGVVSTTTALLLRGSDQVRFVPNANVRGLATLSFKAWDRTFGLEGTRANSTLTTATTWSTATASARVLVNTAPILTPALVPTQPSRTEDVVGGYPLLVSQLIGSAITELDPSTLRGIAITGLTQTTNGTWQSSPDGTTWTTISAVSPSNARLLRSTDRVRFVPIANFNGTASLTFRAWDQSLILGDTSNSGGATPFSSDAATVDLVFTPTNDRPRLDTTRPTTLTSIAPGTLAPAGDLVSRLVSNGIGSDIDGDTLGVALVGLTGTTTGTWRYSLDNGTTWLNVGTVSTTSALLLDPTALLAYVPAGTFMGLVQVSYRAWDRSTGVNGQRLNPAILAISNETLTSSLGVNNAPTLNGLISPSFTAVAEDSTSPAGNVVSSLLGTSMSDVDLAAREGIAIVAADGSNGRWQYQLTATTAWVNFPSVSQSAALSLRDTDRVRFIPNANFTGTATITYHGWDMTSGGAGWRLDATQIGGNTPFSTDTQTASVTVSNLNDTPILNAPRTVTLTAIAPGTTNPVGDSIAALVNGFVSDADPGAMRGVAITATTGTGTWQYSLDGGTTWLNVGVVSATSARLLRSTDLVRFVPAIGFRGTARLTYRAWDQTTGVAGGLFNPTGTAFSTASATAFLAVNNGPDFV